jgi:TPR repeat protein
MLGKMYNEGLGVDKNEFKSFEWFELAKANGYDPKKDEHSALYEDSYSDEKDNQRFLPLSSKKEKHNFQKGECSNCGKSDNLKSCARCKLIQYCSTACQKQHWKAIGGHKKFCVSKEEKKRVLTSQDL